MRFNKGQVEIKIPRTLNEHVVNRTLNEDDFNDGFHIVEKTWNEVCNKLKDMGYVVDSAYSVNLPAEKFAIAYKDNDINQAYRIPFSVYHDGDIEVLEKYIRKERLTEDKLKLDTSYAQDGYWFFGKHGLGPGLIPKDCEVLEWIDVDNGTYFRLNRFLTTSELREYEIKEQTPPSDVLEKRMKESWIITRSKNKILESYSKRDLKKICEDTEYNLGILLMEYASKKPFVKQLTESIDINSLHSAYDTISKLSKRFNQLLNEATATIAVDKIAGIPINKVKAIKVEGEDLYKVISVDSENQEFEVEDSDKEISHFSFGFVADGVNDGDMQLLQIYRPEKGHRFTDDEFLINQVDKSNKHDMLFLQVYDTLAQGLYKGNPKDPKNDWIGANLGHRIKRYDEISTNYDGNIVIRDNSEKGLKSAIEVANHFGLKYNGPRKVSHYPDGKDWVLTIYIE